jgi:hypothetical protein
MQYRRIASGTVPKVHTGNIVLKSVTANHLHVVKFLCYVNLSLSTRWSRTGGRRGAAPLILNVGTRWG